MVDKVLSNQTLLFINCIPTRAKSLNDILQIIFFFLIGFFFLQTQNQSHSSFNQHQKQISPLCRYHIYLITRQPQYILWNTRDRGREEFWSWYRTYVVKSFDMFFSMLVRRQEWRLKQKTYGKNNNHIKFVLWYQYDK